MKRMVLAGLLGLAAISVNAKDLAANLVFECGGVVIANNTTNYVGVGPNTEKQLVAEGQKVLDHANNFSAAAEKSKSKGPCKITWQWGTQAPLETRDLTRGQMTAMLRHMGDFLVKVGQLGERGNWDK